MKISVKLQIEFELDAEDETDYNAVNNLIDELEKVPLIAIGGTVSLLSIESKEIL